MTINLDENQIQEVKETYEKLKNIYENKAQIEILKKERENIIKEGIASICDLRDNEGNTDIKKVKMPLLIALLNEIYNEKENPKETEYSIMQDYRTALEGGEIEAELITSYLHCDEEIKATKDDIKGVFADVSLLDNETCKALEDLAKEYYKEIKQDKMIEAGFIKEKPIKDDSEYNELKENLEVILES